MQISVIGVGYVGLVTATCLANSGNSVICVDNNQAKLEQLKSGKSPIYEPGLDDLFTTNLKANRLIFTDSLDLALEKSEIIFLCLPTPPNEDGSADLSYIYTVAEAIAQKIKSPKIVVTKSTVPVGTADAIKSIFQKHTKIEVAIVSNPEFLREGNAIFDFNNPDRVVLGSDNVVAMTKMRELYLPFVDSPEQILLMDARSSELTKHAANSFLATKISFINQIANLCDKVGGDITKVAIGIGMDNRIGKSFLRAGIGYGGSCFPKDVLSLRDTGLKNGVALTILDKVIEINQNQRINFCNLIHSKLKSLSGLQIAVWGLSFKPKTDDIREAPSYEIIKWLLSQGASVKAFDPVAIEVFQKHHPELNITYCTDKYQALEGSSALLLLTEWNEFVQADLNQIKNTLTQPFIFDGRNVYDPAKMKKLGFEYSSIGRPINLSL